MSNHLVIGGQRSGKSRFAEAVGMRWLAGDHDRAVGVIATALAGDTEMVNRIQRHRLDRPAAFQVFEVPLDLADSLAAQSCASMMLIIDCLPLWMTNWLMPLDGVRRDLESWRSARDAFLHALRQAQGPVVVVTNEIGSGVIPLEPEVRLFVDELGRLNQDVAQACDQITWMVAGQPFTQKVQKW